MMLGADVSTVAGGRRRHLRLIVITLASAAALIGVGVAATASPLFGARTIRVHGAAHLTRAEVLRLAGIAPGTNLFYLDAHAAADRLEQDAWVAGATISKHLPSTVVVDVRERVAVAVVRTAGILRLVGDDGTLLGEAGVDALLPTIAAVEGAPEPSAEAIAGAGRAIAAMSPDARRQITTVSIMPDGQLLLKLSSGAVVTYGPSDELAAKADALAALLRWAASQGTHLSAADVHVP